MHVHICLNPFICHGLSRVLTLENSAVIMEDVGVLPPLCVKQDLLSGPGSRKNIGACTRSWLAVVCESAPFYHMLVISI